MKARLIYAIVVTGVIVGAISLLYFSLEYTIGLVVGAMYMVIIDWLVNE